MENLSYSEIQSQYQLKKQFKQKIQRKSSFDIFSQEIRKLSQKGKIKTAVKKNKSMGNIFANQNSNLEYQKQIEQLKLQLENQQNFRKNYENKSSEKIRHLIQNEEKKIQHQKSANSFFEGTNQLSTGTTPKSPHFLIEMINSRNLNQSQNQSQSNFNFTNNNNQILVKNVQEQDELIKKLSEKLNDLENQNNNFVNNENHDNEQFKEKYRNDKQQNKLVSDKLEIGNDKKEKLKLDLSKLKQQENKNKNQQQLIDLKQQICKYNKSIILAKDCQEYNNLHDKNNQQNLKQQQNLKDLVYNKINEKKRVQEIENTKKENFNNQEKEEFLRDNLQQNQKIEKDKFNKEMNVVEVRQLMQEPSNFLQIQKVNQVQDYHDEFMSNFDNFSLSWRNCIMNEKKQVAKNCIQQKKQQQQQQIFQHYQQQKQQQQNDLKLKE
ncbi:hypothetical protein PPERSA_01990 [Pseudocohnilembus persalinus]|uniref:Uncharacterized protein n=1 Tax=Pseudocohnilembus persalinus TaxID=266149 RepID=A0A0V0QF54_PSEPJ|nr:hypothetical protein PPERSA_01990 [Pseudocohnilembus persalinus]|eukprot:KRX00811.1 hypothetical protein PPERSA_01990 [Pseudocohnilembus persalinus]